MEEAIAFCGTYGFCFAAATFIVWTHPNAKGVVCAAFTLWLFVFIGMVFLVSRYGTGGPGGAIIPLWFLGGWIFSTFFAALLALVRTRLFPPEAREAK